MSKVEYVVTPVTVWRVERRCQGDPTESAGEFEHRAGAVQHARILAQGAQGRGHDVSLLVAEDVDAPVMARPVDPAKAASDSYERALREREQVNKQRAILDRLRGIQPSQDPDELMAKAVKMRELADRIERGEEFRGDFTPAMLRMGASRLESEAQVIRFGQKTDDEMKANRHEAVTERRQAQHGGPIPLRAIEPEDVERVAAEQEAQALVEAGPKALEYEATDVERFTPPPLGAA